MTRQEALGTTEMELGRSRLQGREATPRTKDTSVPSSTLGEGTMIIRQSEDELFDEWEKKHPGAFVRDGLINERCYVASWPKLSGSSQ